MERMRLMVAITLMEIFLEYHGKRKIVLMRVKSGVTERIEAISGIYIGQLIPPCRTEQSIHRKAKTTN
jgi:hypothetical protein